MSSYNLKASLLGGTYQDEDKGGRKGDEESSAERHHGRETWNMNLGSGYQTLSGYSTSLCPIFPLERDN